MALTRNIKCESDHYNRLLSAHYLWFHILSSWHLNSPYMSIQSTVHFITLCCDTRCCRWRWCRWKGMYCHLFLSQDFISNVPVIDMSSYQLHNQCFPRRICPNGLWQLLEPGDCRWYDGFFGVVGYGGSRRLRVSHRSLKAVAAADLPRRLAAFDLYPTPRLMSSFSAFPSSLLLPLKTSELKWDGIRDDSLTWDERDHWYVWLLVVSWNPAPLWVAMLMFKSHDH